MKATHPHPEIHEALDLDGTPLSWGEIHTVVDTFYGRIQTDPILEVPFRTVLDWPHHIERLTHFWWIRLGGRPYLNGMYNPVEKHFLAGFNPPLLKRWLALFKKTIEENVSPEAGVLWIEIAEHMGQALSMKNDAYSEMMKDRN
jgi:hemoglobin